MLITEYLRGVSECAFVFCFKFNLSPHKFLWVISRNWLKEGIHDRVIFISISRKRVHLVLQQLLTLHWTLPGKSSASKSKIQIALIPHFQLLSNTREEEAGQCWKYFRSFSWFYVQMGTWPFIFIVGGNSTCLVIHKKLLLGIYIVQIFIRFGNIALKNLLFRSSSACFFNRLGFSKRKINKLYRIKVPCGFQYYANICNSVVARGMAYLHNEPNVIIHRDLKPRWVICVRFHFKLPSSVFTYSCWFFT